MPTLEDKSPGPPAAPGPPPRTTHDDAGGPCAPSACLAAVDRACRRLLTATAADQVLQTGEVIITQGQMPTGVWLIDRGVLEVTGRPGGDKALIEHLTAGAVVGDIPLLAGSPAVVTVRAVTTATAGYLDAGTFRELLARNPCLAQDWLATIARRHLRAQDLAVDAAHGGTASSRLARLLLREAHGGIVVCTQSDLAAMTGIRRPTINRILREFDAAGLVKRQYRSIELASPQGLRRAATC